ncbi:acyl carrier protein [Solirubrobacter taibaiensis]|nr:acyl carrier protein [Solirubrobacter taibaiensis]
MIERRLLSVMAIEDWLQEHIALMLGVAPEHVDPTQPFAAIGLRSADAVALTGELADWLDIPVDATAPWDHPTPEALAAALHVYMSAGSATVGD